MFIFEWDIAVFEFINTDLSNAFFDWLLPMWRQPFFWVPLYIFLIAFVIINYSTKSYWFVLFVILTVSSSDLLSSRAIKKTIRRIRPCHTEYVQTIERVPCGSGYSFTSTHAANHFAISTFLILTLGQHLRRIIPWLWAWAASVAFAQVYVGVHFPLDVIGGAILGVILGKCWFLLFQRYYGDVFDQKISMT
ncbi:MAG: phosphatase PAP2 family protein [Saprospiraceae bacterium]|nr:phosphatase PAP2 family protein [Saprospiraceae bacterium]